MAPMNRRGFLSACLALAAAPAIVRASSLMPGRVLTPTLMDDGSILFDGTDNYLKCDAFTLGMPPVTVYMLAKNIAVWQNRLEAPALSRISRGLHAWHLESGWEHHNGVLVRKPSFG